MVYIYATFIRLKRLAVRHPHDPARAVATRHTAPKGGIERWAQAPLGLARAKIHPRGAEAGIDSLGGGGHR